VTEVGDHYAEVERKIAKGLATRLGDGMRSDRWAAVHAGRVGAVQRWVSGVLAAAARRLGTAVGRALSEAHAAGRAEVAAPVMRPSRVAAAVLPQQELLASRARAVHQAAAQYAVDIYRGAVAAGLGLDGRGDSEFARRRSVQRALDRAAEQGVTGFVDARGRRWSLASYLEMAAATAAKEAQLQGTISGLRDLGHTLAYVRGGPQECSICRPWLGTILTLDDSGRGGTTLVLPSAVTSGRMVTVRVAGSLAEARAAGLFHPRCRCALRVYRPGAAGPAAAVPDPEGDAARQKLRAMERAVREARQREALALDDAARQKAADLIRVRRARLRAHVRETAHLGIQRDQRRESANLGFRA